MNCAFCGYGPNAGRLCDHCGMAMPSFANTAERVDERGRGAANVPRIAELSSAMCRQCGVATTAVRCPGCGVPVSRDD